MEQALAEQESRFDPERPGAWAARRLLTLLIDAGERTEAEAVLGRVLDLYTPHLRPEHPGLSGSLEQVVDVLIAREQLDLARTALERIAHAKTAGYGPEHPEVFASLRRLADVQRRQGDLPGAAATLHRLLGAVRAHHGDDHEQVAATLLELGDATAAGGDLAAALPLLEQAMTVMARVRGEHPSTASFAIDVALAVHRAGDLARARTILDSAVALAARTYGEGHEEVARGLRALKEVAARQGDADAAQAAEKRLAGRPTGPTAGRVRLSRAYLERLEPGWETAIPPVDLAVLAAGLTTLAEDLARIGDAEAAARARQEARRAQSAVR